MRTILRSVAAALMLAAGACSPENPDTEALGVDRAPNPPADTSAAPSGTAADLMSQIENRKGRIEVALLAGNLPEARNLTAEVRELASALELRASGLPDGEGARVIGAVARVDASARALEAAAAKSEGQAADREFERLKEALRELARVPFPS